jgi:hypothetical protein
MWIAQKEKGIVMNRVGFEPTRIAPLAVAADTLLYHPEASAITARPSVPLVDGDSEDHCLLEVTDLDDLSHS